MIDYKNIKTDKDKLFACYSLIEQMRLEHNRQAAIARSNPEKYIKSGKWYLYALKPTRDGGNVFWKEMMPLLQEQNRLRDKIRKAAYTDKQWMALSDEERDAAFITLFGNKQSLKEEPTKATYSSIDSLKLINLDDVGEAKVPDPYQDFFNDYTEVDEDGDITIAGGTPNKISFTTMRRDALSHVRRDMGAGHFGDFEHLITVNINTASTNNGGIQYWALSNGDNTLNQMDVSNSGISAYIYKGAGIDHFNIHIIRDWSNDNNDSYTDAAGTITRYCTIERSDTTLTDKIYDDPAREAGDLLDTLTIICAATTWRYVYGMQSFERSTAPAETCTGYTENLDLQEAVPTFIPRITGII